MKIVGIYKITNLIDGKVYIGQTVNYNKRKKRVKGEKHKPTNSC